ncbi:hypothetical protein ACIP5L_06180 [Streptomyces bacillaris]|uniref:hypothetical protein n=1 Tax=Streptomyces bacillaris TaxID=68179 RepID=UPI00382535C5
MVRTLNRCPAARSLADGLRASGELGWPADAVAAAYGGGRCGTGYQAALILKLVAGPDRLTAWDISGTGAAKDRLKGPGQG